MQEGDILEGQRVHLNGEPFEPPMRIQGVFIDREGRMLHLENPYFDEPLFIRNNDQVRIIDEKTLSEEMHELCNRRRMFHWIPMRPPY